MSKEQMRHLFSIPCFALRWGAVLSSILSLTLSFHVFLLLYCLLCLIIGLSIGILHLCVALACSAALLVWLLARPSCG